MRQFLRRSSVRSMIAEVMVNLINFPSALVDQINGTLP